jgi:hypothetical protein
MLSTEEALRGGDHLVARPDAAKLQGDLDRRRRRGHCAHRSAAAERREIVFEALNPGAAGDVP